eukprot:4313192-Pyramimonas_sp.AAC.1
MTHDSLAGRLFYANSPGGHVAASAEASDGTFSTRATPRGNPRAHDMMRSHMAQNSTWTNMPQDAPSCFKMPQDASRHQT